MSSETTESTRSIEFLAWLEINQKKLIAGGLVLVLLASAISVYRWRSKQQETAANSALVQLQMRRVAGDAQDTGPKPEELLALSSKYRSTKAGQRALLLAAEAQFRAGNYSESEATFQSFLTAHSTDPMAATAALGLASCLDATGKTDQAIAAYREVIASYAGSAAASHAKLALAGLLESRSDAQQALQYYEQLRTTAWMSEAETRRQALLARHPELSPTNSISPSASTPNVAAPQSAID